MKNIKLYETFGLNESKISNAKWKSTITTAAKFEKDMNDLYDVLKTDKTKYKKCLTLLDKLPNIDELIKNIQNEIFIADTKKM